MISPARLNPTLISFNVQVFGAGIIFDHGYHFL